MPRSRKRASQPIALTEGDVPFTLTYKRVKGLRMHLTHDGRVCVSAPFGMPEQEVRAFVAGHREWIARATKKTLERQPALLRNPSHEDVARWRAQVEALTPALVAQYERKMGVKVQRIAYRSMVSRWGSCTPRTGRICINVQLARFPVECLEMVVVHELCHLLEANHGARFYAHMDTYLPDWRARKALLRTASAASS